MQIWIFRFWSQPEDHHCSALVQTSTSCQCCCCLLILFNEAFWFPAQYLDLDHVLGLYRDRPGVKGGSWHLISNSTNQVKWSNSRLHTDPHQCWFCFWSWCKSLYRDSVTVSFMYLWTLTCDIARFSNVQLIREGVGEGWGHWFLRLWLKMKHVFLFEAIRAGFIYFMFVQNFMNYAPGGEMNQVRCSETKTLPLQFHYHWEIYTLNYVIFTAAEMKHV